VAEVKTAGVIGYGNAGEKHWATYHSAGLKALWFDPQYEDSATLDAVLACDVVSTCSPDDTHYEHFIAALRHGPKHVLLEKPLTHSAVVLKGYEEYAAKFGADCTIDCHLPLRYHPPFVQALGEVRAGCLGKIISIDMAYHYGRPEKLKGWRGQIPNYSLIVGGGIHLVDLALQMAGDRLRGIGGVMWHHLGSSDTRSMFAIGEGAQGIMCTLATTCYEHIPHLHEMRIIGTAGVREIQNTEEVDHARGVRLFLDKVRNGQRGNIAEAIAANRICVQLAEALR
jgi:predicted dehydrogenase